MGTIHGCDRMQQLWVPASQASLGTGSSSSEMRATAFREQATELL